MSGIELRGDVLSVDREPTTLDRLAIDVSAILADLDIDHALVAGYVAILAGRARSTEDIDLILEPLDRVQSRNLVAALEDAGFWGSTTPLSELSTMLSSGGNVRVAPEGEVVPNIELSYATDRFDRASIENAITASIGGHELPIGPLELQIAYKLYLGSQKDFEDAIHLHGMFGESLSERELERWVDALGVEDAYDRLE
ncbi:hypothetical protein HLRTI_000627 [Halorhabdus tiamatea SARL4B]|uniref:Nucleotidyltransferase family protein n=1 Tax=Halorhabdus tiamatea SARL4B TaxID=1033806 RepID=F7PG09_9EURY|nr:hypothetical protein [Halorhabdus tiamatea]ERJ07269.1 hypothetical protein HLRTI_000627 [Halorhabdus tiamatea SARL4B]CCQ34178.1 conserved hypothetical protein [Halorhabdus tiamatea SARL4B]